MAFSLLPREDEYFTLFSQVTEKIQEATTALVDMLSDDSSNFEAHAKRILRRGRARRWALFQQPTKNPGRDLLRVRPGVSFGTDARRAAGSARTAVDQIARALQQIEMHVVQRTAEANAARVVVVDEDVRLRGKRLGNASLRPADAIRSVETSTVDGQPDIVPVAHQQELGDVLHREREANHPVPPRIAAKRQPRHHT